MKKGRDWSFWFKYDDMNTQEYIVKLTDLGVPFPIFKGQENEVSWRTPKTPIFHIKAWGRDGYK